MEDIPQPAQDPLDIGDRVQIYVGVDDPDEEYHGMHAVIVERFEDDLGEETGRNLDRWNYRVKPIGGTEPIPITFRQRDLIPTREER